MNPGVEDTRVSIISEAAKHFGIVQRNQVRAEVKELPSILGEKELPEKLVPCQNSFGMGLLVATNQRLVYLNKLPLGSLQIENYRYDDITSIEFKTTTLIRGVLRISVSGDRKEFANVPKKLINAFAEHLRTKVPPENLLPDPEDSGPAPSPELAEAISAAAQELGSSYRATVKKELDELPSILGEEELPEKMMVGWYDGGEGLLVATDERLIFIDKRRFTGLRVEYFVYKNITSVQSKTGMVTGSIGVHAAGNVEMISGLAKELAHPFAKYLRQKVSSAQSPVHVPAPTPQAVSSLADELKKLAELVEMSILTKEEFDQQKAKLLGT